MKNGDNLAAVHICSLSAGSFEAQRSAFNSKSTHSCQSSNLIHFWKFLLRKVAEKT